MDLDPAQSVDAWDLRASAAGKSGQEEGRVDRGRQTAARLLLVHAPERRALASRRGVLKQIEGSREQLCTAGGDSAVV